MLVLLRIGPLPGIFHEISTRWGPDLIYLFIAVGNRKVRYIFSTSKDNGAKGIDIPCYCCERFCSVFLVNTNIIQSILQGENIQDTKFNRGLKDEICLFGEGTNRKNNIWTSNCFGLCSPKQVRGFSD